MGGGKQPNPKLPLPFHPWSGPFWGESGTNTNFWLPTVPADPDLGFFCPSLALGGSSGGGRAGGAAKNTHETPPTHTLSAQLILGGKAAESVKPPEGRGFPPVLGGFGVGRCPHATSGGVPALPPPPDAPNRPEAPQICRPSPHPSPRGTRGGAQGGGGAHPVPATADLGGFCLKFEAPTPCSLLHLLVLGTKV